MNNLTFLTTSAL